MLLFAENGASSASLQLVRERERWTSKEMRIAITLVTILSVHVAIYTVLSASWQLLYVDHVLRLLTASERDFVYRVGKIADCAAILIRLWNFYVYFIRYFHKCKILSGIESFLKMQKSNKSYENKIKRR